MYPLSFSEFMTYYAGSPFEGWNEYITYGGIPLVVLAETEVLLDVLASAIGALTNPNKLQKIFKSVRQSKITATTITKYIECLEDAFMIEEAKRYDIKGKSYIGTPVKYYS